MSTGISDPHWFSLTWFGQTLDHVCHERQLVRLRLPAPEAVRLLPSVESGHVVAVSPELSAGSCPIGVVVGGPCIGDCLAFPTLEALYDSVQLLLTARSYGVPALVYLGDREESLFRGGGRRWTRLADRFAGWIGALAELLGVERVCPVHTSSDAHNRAIAAASSPARAVPEARLDRAFHLGSGPVLPGDDTSRQSTRLVIEAHVRSVVSCHVELEPTQGVLVAENLQQAGAFQLSVEVDPEASLIHYVGHLPAPSLSGNSRMYRASAWDKLPAWDLVTIAEGSMPGVHPYVREFFACWLEPELRDQLSATARSAWPG